MNLIKKALFSTLIFIIVLFSLFYFLLTTQPGLYISLRMAKLFVPGSLRIHNLEGRLLDRFSIGELHYHYQNNILTLKNLHMHWDLHALLQRTITINQLTSHSIILERNGTSVTLKKLHAQGTLAPQRTHIESLELDYIKQHIHLIFDLSPIAPNPLSGKMTIAPLKPQKDAFAGKLKLGGTLNAMQWTGDFSGPADVELQGTLSNFAELKQTIKWRNLHETGKTNTTRLSSEGRMTLNGRLPDLTIALDSNVKHGMNNVWHTKVQAKGTLPWQWTMDAQVSQQEQNAEVDGLYTAISTKAVITDSQHAKVTLLVQPGHFHSPAESALPSLEFKGGTLTAHLTPKGLIGEGSLAVDTNTGLQLNFKLPQFDALSGLSEEQRVIGSLTVAIKSLDFLQDINPELSQPQGSLTALLKVYGTIKKPVIESQLNLDKGSVFIPSLGLHLNDITTSLKAKGKTWNATGSIRSGGKQLLLKGQGPLSTAWTGDISIQGTDFPIINTQEYQINASPQLTLKVSPSVVHIAGYILVPQAKIMPQNFSNSLGLSEDVVFKSDQEQQPPLFNSTMDVKVVAGNEVSLAVKGLNATLTGKVHLRQQAGGPITANGELTVQEGHYKAYGQDLAIEQGQLIFTGGSVDNPGVNLRASKKINNTKSSLSASNQLFDFNSTNLQSMNIGNNITAGVEVTGRLTAPKIELFSNPAVLSQADILSMLILGRPASQANKAGGQLLLTALSSMNLGADTNGAKLLDQLKDSLGFDFNVQTNTNFNQSTNQYDNSTGLVVGKSLSKRLYLSYNVGLSQADPNVLTLKYLLNKFFSIQISNSTTGSGIDFLYSRSKDKIND